MEVIFYVSIGVVFLLILYVLVTYNNLTKQKNNVVEAFSTMDVYLKKRWDLIPNIVEVVKGYSKYEKDTLEGVVSLRNDNYDNMSMNNKIEKNEQVTSMLSRLIMLAEDYPDLKANDEFLNLSKELHKVEEDIANARKYYNAVVRENNNNVEMIPSNIIAKIFGFKSQKMFQATESERENVNVEL